MSTDLIPELKALICRVLKKPEDFEIPDDSLLQRLGLDSIQTMEILIWVEDEFDITISDDDLSPELLDSLDALASYVSARRVE